MHDLYVCTVYIPPVISVHYDNDFALLESEVSIFANQGKVLLIGDFNSRTGQSPDYILNDSTDLNNFSDNYILPRNYSVDQILKRNNQDQICNTQGKNLLHLCIAAKLRILNVVLFILNFITGFTNSEYSRYFAISSFLYFKIMVPNSNFSKASSDIRIII
jgi:hypothetical protein